MDDEKQNHFWHKQPPAKLNRQETTSATKTTEELKPPHLLRHYVAGCASSDVGEGKINTRMIILVLTMAVALIGFIIVALVIHRTPGGSRRRRRRDEYEFDIIPGEDYSDSEEETDSLDLGEKK